MRQDSFIKNKVYTKINMYKNEPCKGRLKHGKCMQDFLIKIPKKYFCLLEFIMDYILRSFPPTSAFQFIHEKFMQSLRITILFIYKNFHAYL